MNSIKNKSFNQPSKSNSDSTPASSTSGNLASNNIYMTANDQYTQSDLLLTHAKSMDEVLNNYLIKDAFKLVKVKSTISDEGDEAIPDDPDADFVENLADIVVNDDRDDAGEWIIYCLGCCDRSLKAQQGKDVRANHFKVEDIHYSKGNKTMAPWFSHLKFKLRRHISYLGHHKMTISYNCYN